MNKIIIEIFSGFLVGSFIGFMISITYLLGILVGKIMVDELNRKD